MDMEQWLEIRRPVLREGVSERQLLRETGMHWRTLKKILTHPSGPGNGRTLPRQPGDDYVVVRLGAPVPFEGPEIVEADPAHRAVHEAHVDAAAVTL